MRAASKASLPPIVAQIFGRKVEFFAQCMVGRGWAAFLPRSARRTSTPLPAAAGLDMLADLLGGSGAVLVELGKFADASYIAGRTCERIADQLQPADQ